VTGVSVGASGDGASVTIAVSGDASFEWHRLREPDNRFWIDFKWPIRAEGISKQ